jgi:hypothetical protein
MPIGVSITGDRKLVERFEKFPEFAREALLERIKILTDRLAAATRAEMPHKTGSLINELRQGIENNPNRIRGWVSLAGASKKDVLRAQALEYGSHKTIAVQAYTRNVDRVFGKLTGPFSQVVGAYRRQTDIVEQRFLRNPVAAMQEAVVADLKAAIEKAAQTQP